MLTCSLVAAQAAEPRPALAALSAARVQQPQAPVFDQPGDGSVWAAGETYKAVCDGEAFTYVPFLGSDAPRNFPLRLRLRSASAGGNALPLLRGVPERNDCRVTIDRGALTEIYDFAPSAVEQSFAFAQLPGRGDLVLGFDVDSELHPEPDAEGITFRGALGAVSYAHAVAVDAAGARQPLAIGWADGRITLTVPAAFVADCRLPLVVDPILSTVTFAPTSYHEDAPTVAYCWGSGEAYYAVWQRHYSATDRDVYAQRLDTAMALVGTRLAVDLTYDSWDGPRVAASRLLPRLLIVAQVTPAGNSGPSWIGGRMLRADAGTLDPVLTIDRQGTTGHHDGNKLTPDVGGDTNTTLTNYFTVVWSREAAPGNRDIHLKQVTMHGALRSATATVVDASPADEHSPAISRGNGYWVAARQRWALTWVRTEVRSGVPDGDIRAAIVTREGQVEALAGGAPFPLATTTDDDAVPAVSALVDSNPANFCYLCTFTRRVGAERDVTGVVFDSQGVVRSTQNLSQLSGGLAGVDQWSPSVDTDATRFVVTYTEGGSGVSRTYASLLAWDGVANQLLAQGARTPLAAGYQQDARICARSSGGPSHTHYAVVHTMLPAGGKRHVGAVLFEGVLPGGYAMRATGCGGLVVTPQGTPAIGHFIRFEMNHTAAIGMLLGLPAHIDLPCAGGCALGVSNPILLMQNYLAIPPNPRLVGAVVGVQGFHLGSGTCLASIALGNTWDVTIQ